MHFFKNMLTLKFSIALLLFILDISIKNSNNENIKEQGNIKNRNNNEEDNEQEQNNNNNDNNEIIDNNNFMDNGNEFQFFDESRIIHNNSFDKNKIYKFNFKNNTKLKKIPVAFSVDHNYIYPLIVLLTSILYNSSPKTYYSFHILVPSNFTETDKKKLFSLIKLHPNCEFILHDMGEGYKYWDVYGNYTQTVYYRLALSDVIKDLDKIIYLDCDTTVHKDLTNLYNLKMGNYCYMGFPGHEIGYMEINGTRNFINSGVMLVNLKRLREINAPQLFENYYNEFGTKKVDEYLINVIFYDKIKFLPFIYGIPDFEEHHIIGSPTIFYESLNGSCPGTPEDMIKASENRVITHGAYKDIKWWSRDYDELSDIGKKWIFYASKTQLFDEICKKYVNFKKICYKIKLNKLKKNL